MEFLNAPPDALPKYHRLEEQSTHPELLLSPPPPPLLHTTMPCLPMPALLKHEDITRADFMRMASAFKTESDLYRILQLRDMERWCNYYGQDGFSRRKNATRESTNILKAWLREHKKNPYPTKGEKIMLAVITRMTLTQISTWFANARRRIKKEKGETSSPSPIYDDPDEEMMTPSSQKEKEALEEETLPNTSATPIWSLAEQALSENYTYRSTMASNRLKTEHIKTEVLN